VTYFRNACIASGATWTSTQYALACQNPLVPWDWDAVMANPEAAAQLMTFVNTCYQQGGYYRASSTWAGCYCPGTTPFPAVPKCSRSYAYDGTLHKNCEGPCNSGSSCVDLEGSCKCKSSTVPSGYTCAMNSGSICGGTCPSGTWCTTNIPMTACWCSPPFV
jgi:hypothetical protein